MYAFPTVYVEDFPTTQFYSNIKLYDENGTQLAGSSSLGYLRIEITSTLWKLYNDKTQDIYLQYTSEDGHNWTRQTSLENNKLPYIMKVYYTEYYSLDQLTIMLKTIGKCFNGLYRYEVQRNPDFNIAFTNFELTSEAECEEVWLEVAGNTHLQNILLQLKEVLRNGTLVKKKTGEYELFATSDKDDYVPPSVYNNKLYVSVYETDVKLYKYSLDLENETYTSTELTAVRTVDSDYVLFDGNLSVEDIVTPINFRAFENSWISTGSPTESITMYYTNDDHWYRHSTKLVHKPETKYYLAKTQLTLRTPDELSIHSVGYGKNGVITGTYDKESYISNISLLSNLWGEQVKTLTASPESEFGQKAYVSTKYIPYIIESLTDLNNTAVYKNINLPENFTSGQYDLLYTPKDLSEFDYVTGTNYQYTFYSYDNRYAICCDFTGGSLKIFDTEQKTLISYTLYTQRLAYVTPLDDSVILFYSKMNSGSETTCEIIRYYYAEEKHESISLTDSGEEVCYLSTILPDLLHSKIHFYMYSNTLQSGWVYSIDLTESEFKCKKLLTFTASTTYTSMMTAIAPDINGTDINIFFQTRNSDRSQFYGRYVCLDGITDTIKEDSGGKTLSKVFDPGSAYTWPILMTVNSTHDSTYCWFDKNRINKSTLAITEETTATYPSGRMDFYKRYCITGWSVAGLIHTMTIYDLSTTTSSVLTMPHHVLHWEKGVSYGTQGSTPFAMVKCEDGYRIGTAYVSNLGLAKLIHLTDGSDNLLVTNGMTDNVTHRQYGVNKIQVQENSTSQNSNEPETVE